MTFPSILKEKRIALGFTQEQIAQRLGVTAPAVNKWERGVSLPDITLLPPLARLLGTDLNTLMAFQEELTTEEIEHIASELYAIAQSKGVAAAFDAAQTHLQQYPSCGRLLYHLASTLDSTIFLFAPEEREAYREKLLSLYQQAADCGDREIADAATVMLLSDASSHGDLDKAQAYLDTLPGPPPVEKPRIQAGICRRRGEQEKAMELLERLILNSATNLSSDLMTLSEIAWQMGKPDDAASFADLAAEIAHRCDLMGCLQYVPAFQLAVLRQDADASIAALEQLLSSMKQRWDLNDSPLYRHIPGVNSEKEFSETLLPTMVKQMLADEELAFLRDDPRFLRLAERFQQE